MKRTLSLSALLLASASMGPRASEASPPAGRAQAMWQRATGRTQLSPIEQKQLQRLERGVARWKSTAQGLELSASITTRGGTEIRYGLSLVSDQRGEQRALATTEAHKPEGRTVTLSESEVGHYGVRQPGVVRKAWALGASGAQPWRVPEHLRSVLGPDLGSLGMHGAKLLIERYQGPRPGQSSRGVQISRRNLGAAEGYTFAPPPVSPSRRLLLRLYEQIVQPQLVGLVGPAYRQASAGALGELARLLASSPATLQRELALMLPAQRGPKTYEIVDPALRQRLGELGSALTFQQSRGDSQRPR